MIALCSRAASGARHSGALQSKDRRTPSNRLPVNRAKSVVRRMRKGVSEGRVVSSLRDARESLTEILANHKKSAAQ
jgi:hypothetical protein